jgi:glucokinase
MSATARAAERTVLVGDVGGTHARFASVDCSVEPWRIAHRLDLDEPFPAFADALRAYLTRSGLTPLPRAAAIAVAGPVTGGSVALTNRKWQTSETELRQLGFSHALLLNDFAAIAFAAANLAPDQLQTIGPELAGLKDEPISIIGAGTGFGASLLARYRGRSVAVATEGGHISFAPGNERESQVLAKLRRQYGHVSVERILSGPGLENLHQALVELSGRKPMPMHAADIAERAGRGDAECSDTIAVFCAIYGSVAGDLALAHGARGGIFLAGGIAKKIRPMLLRSEFRARFEDKGRLSGFVNAIPTRLILTEDVTFLGAARAAQDQATP